MRHVAFWAMLSVLSSCAFEVDTSGMKFSGGETVDSSTLHDAWTDLWPEDLNRAEEVVPADAGDASGLEIGEPDASEDLTHQPCEDHAKCDDGIECTQDMCIAGDCQHESLDSLCDGGDFCRKYVCSVFDGGCVSQPRNQGKECTSIVNNACVLFALCDDAGLCVPTEDGYVLCPETDCLKEGACDEMTGECDYKEMTGTKCDDDNPCTVDTKCMYGVCVGDFGPKECPCESDLQCIDYDDDDLCNGLVICMDGYCNIEPSTVVECAPPPAGGCYEFVCSPESGECMEKPRPQGTWCDDGNDCTDGDECGDSGSCGGSKVADGAECESDDDKCTMETCEDGECMAGAVMVCVQMEDKPCFDYACDPKTGECIDVPLPDGTPCKDDEECTINETCKFAQCTGGLDICAECELADDAGHPCDDGDADTNPDFCFEKTCSGFKKSIWTDPAATATYMPHATSIGQAFHSLGHKFKELDGITISTFVEFDSTGQLEQPEPYPGSPLLQIDGRVAVGPQKRIYYHGSGWTEYNKLKGAVEENCKGLANKHYPSSVAHRTYASDTGVGTGDSDFLEMTIVGFRIKSTNMTDKCLLTICGKLSDDSWTCSSLTFDDLFQNTPSPGIKPWVTALWMPTGPIACAEPNLSCFDGSHPVYFALNTTISGGYRIYIMKAYADDNGGTQFKTVHTEEVFDQPQVMTLVTDMRVDKAGNFFAVGTNDLIVVSKKNGQKLVPPHLSILLDTTAHYYGVYRSAKSTVLVANLLKASTDSLGQETTFLQAGVVAGSESMLFDLNGTGKGFFIQLVSFHLPCVTCYEEELGTWGTTDMAVLLDHLESGNQLPGAPAQTMAVIGTVPDAQSDSPVGAVAIISAIP